jgi:hypothetical protein
LIYTSSFIYIYKFLTLFAQKALAAIAMGNKVPKNLLLRLGLACLAFVSVITQFTLSYAASVSFNYNFSTPGALTSPELVYMSNATAAGDRIDLTKDTTWSTGRVAYGLPVQLWDNSTGKVASFTSNFTFVIKPHNNAAGQACRSSSPHPTEFLSSCVKRLAFVRPDVFVVELAAGRWHGVLRREVSPEPSE